MIKSTVALMFAVVLSFLSFPVPAFAGPDPNTTITTVEPTPGTSVTTVAPPASSGFSRAMHQIVELLAYAMGLALTALLGKLILAFERKTKIDIPDAGEVALNSLLDKGIAYAEEQGHKAVKKGSKKLEMGESLETAADFVLDLAESKKVKQLGKDKLKKLIESRLAVARATPAKAK